MSSLFVTREGHKSFLLFLLTAVPPPPQAWPVPAFPGPPPLSKVIPALLSWDSHFFYTVCLGVTSTRIAEIVTIQSSHTTLYFIIVLLSNGNPDPDCHRDRTATWLLINLLAFFYPVQIMMFVFISFLILGYSIFKVSSNPSCLYFNINKT